MLAYTSHAHIRSQAYRLSITGKKYVWMIMNWAAVPGWPITLEPVWGTPPQSRCTTEELYTAAEGYIGLEFKYLDHENTQMISGKVWCENP